MIFTNIFNVSLKIALNKQRKIINIIFEIQFLNLKKNIQNFNLLVQLMQSAYFSEVNHLKNNYTYQLTNNLPAHQLNGILCLQQSQNIRLQRLIQQRKRMEHMSNLIVKQNDSIQILTQQNVNINQSFYQLKVQKDILQDQLHITVQQCQNLKIIVSRQVQIIQNLKETVLNNYQLSEYQKALLLQQIQSINLKNFSRANKLTHGISFNDKLNLELSRLAEQNYVLNQKYGQLCKDYHQLTKNDKMKEFQILELNKKIKNKQNTGLFQSFACKQTNVFSPSQRQNSNKNNSLKKEKFAKNKQSQKDNQIEKLKAKIKELQEQINKKDTLLDFHRSNEVQQKKLLSCLKQQFKNQGKQISQIIKSKHIIQDQIPLKQQLASYEVQKTITKSIRQSKKAPQNKIIVEEVENMILDEQKSSAEKNRKSLNLPTFSQPPFKKTISKLNIS